MKPKPDSIETHLLHLPAGEPARLAALLFADPEAADADTAGPGEQAQLDAAWVEKAERRYVELASGAVAGIPSDEVYAELRAELGAMRDA